MLEIIRPVRSALECVNESHNILNYFPDLSFPRGRPLTVEGVGWGDVFFPKNLNILRTDLEDNAKK